MDHLKLALDWTPNINHIGFFVALEKGFYQEQELEVDIMSPDADNYQTTPAKKVELGLADFALCPTESLISFQTKEKPFKLTAIAAILQQDLSAIVIKKGSDINSPKDLDGKSYASYKARYEDEIVKQMIRNDGGKGDINVVYPDKLGIWDTIINDGFDSTWIFLNWEGVEAAADKVDLAYFKMSDYNIPYSYSPVIATNEENISAKKSAYARFLTATKQGFLYCKEHPEEAAKILKNHLPAKDQKIDLIKAIAISSEALGTEETWGTMDLANISEFLNWIYSKNLESKKLQASDLFTNHLILK